MSAVLFDGKRRNALFFGRVKISLNLSSELLDILVSYKNNFYTVYFSMILKMITMLSSDRKKLIVHFRKIEFVIL